eukprot:2484073-Amphidinium_carterae.1
MVGEAGHHGRYLISCQHNRKSFCQHVPHQLVSQIKKWDVEVYNRNSFNIQQDLGFSKGRDC